MEKFLPLQLILQIPELPGQLKWGGGGGFLKSTDYGNTWVSQSAFNGQNMWGVHVQPTDGNVVITGCYSCGNWNMEIKKWRTNVDPNSN
ncbi:MAG: hypothetical protein MZV64_68480 [Ignavibacteriales bacterium]|nr:hypothetical protein [Ignavibacteriales bacterium]